MLDKDTIDIIIKLNGEQSKQFEKALQTKEENDNLKIKGVHKSINAGFEAIKIEMQERNNKVGKINSRLDELAKETNWWRYFQRNPKKTALMLCVFVVGSVVIMGFDIDAQKLVHAIKNLIP